MDLKAEKQESSEPFAPSEDIESSESLSFNPPVYIQRYFAVINVLNQEKWRNKISKVVDFGCSDFKLFKYIKTLESIEHVFAVDIDEDLMPRCQYAAKPMLFGYLNSFNRNLTVDLFVGSIAEPDARLVGVDAVICIELIEHLYPKTLEKVPFTIFECLRPKLAIFTTPNADFNVLFKLKGFRHDDHKFEWSRKEFENWCYSILRVYEDYEVYFEGIGQGPKSTEHLGCVSQMAIFTRRESLDTDPKCEVYSQVIAEPYKLFTRIEYPFKKDERSNEEKLLDEIKYSVNNVFMNKLMYAEYQTDDGCEIPISYLWNQVTSFCQSEEELKTKLLEIGYEIGPNENGVDVVKVSEWDSDSHSDNLGDSSDCDTINSVTPQVEGIWD